ASDDGHRVAAGIESDGAAVERLIVHCSARLVAIHRYLHPEKRGVFEKELAFFGKEDIETGSIIYLLIHIGLGKISVGCQIEHRVRRYGPFQVAAVFKARSVGRLGAVEVFEMVVGRQYVRVDDDIWNWWWRLQVGEQARIVHMSGAEYAGERRESAYLIGKPPVPVHVETPALYGVLTFGIAQRLPWNSDLGHPA